MTVSSWCSSRICEGERSIISALDFHRVREAVNFAHCVAFFNLPLNCVSLRSVAVIFTTGGTKSDGSVDTDVRKWWGDPVAWGGITLSFGISLSPGKSISVNDSRVSKISAFETCLIFACYDPTFDLDFPSSSLRQCFGEVVSLNRF